MENKFGELLTVGELAQRLKVKKSFLYARTRERGEGAIPCIRVGKYIRLIESDVIEWLKNQQRERD